MVQESTPLTNPAPAVLFTSVNVTVVPSGAGPKPVAPSPGAPLSNPSSCWTFAVMVCGASSGFTAVSGDSAIFAFTKRSTASPVSAPAPPVATSKVDVPIVTLASAWPVIDPVWLEVNVTVQSPFASVPTIAQLSTMFVATAPPDATSVTVGYTPTAGLTTPATDWVTWTMNVCVSPTSSTESVAIPIIAPHNWKEPATKSLRTASVDWEERVSRMTDEKHSPSR